MACITFLFLTVSLLVLLVLGREWIFSLWDGAGWFVDDDEESAFASNDTPEAIDRETATLERRIADLKRTGGSGIWTASFAAACLRRRVTELRRRRQSHIDRSRRWNLPVNDPTGIHQPHRQDRSRTDVQARDDLPRDGW